MQNKITIAATLAATTTAIKLGDEEAKSGYIDYNQVGPGYEYGPDYGHGPVVYGMPTPVGEDGAVDCERYGYAPQCLEQKVDKVLGRLVDEVEDRRAECLVTAGDLRALIVSGVQQLKVGLEGDLTRAVSEAEESILARTKAGIATVAVARDEANAALGAESIAVNGRIAAAREETEAAVKELYESQVYGYGGSQGGYGHGYGYAQANDEKVSEPYAVKDEIKKIVEAFDALIEAEGAAFDEFVGVVQETLEGILAVEIQELVDLSAVELAEWNEGADVISQVMADEISAQISSMEGVIADKTTAIDAMALDLKDNFEDRFWIQLEEMVTYVQYQERQTLVKKALLKKDEFLATVQALRDDLVGSLNETRSTLIGELNVERDGFAGALGENRADLVRFIASSAESLAEAAGAGREAVGERAIRETDGLEDNFIAEGKQLEEFLYSLAKYAYRPHGYAGYGYAKQGGQGYLPYVKHVVNDLEAQIAAFGQNLLAEFDVASEGVMGLAQSGLVSEQTALSSDASSLVVALQAHTSTAIENITAAREALEIGLGEAQTAQEEQDEAARDILQVALISKKNELWKAISWITRKQYSYGSSSGHRGYGYGGRQRRSRRIKDRRRNQYAQDAAEEEGYGYGRYGYGYNRINDKIEAMAAAVTDTRSAAADIIQKSKDQLDADLIAATDAYQVD